MMRLLPSITAIVLVILIIDANPIDGQLQCSNRTVESSSGSGLGSSSESGSRSNCGDGDLDLGEECDDNNTMPNDGCSANCMVEPGYRCCTNGLNVLSYCTVIGCGDGEIAFSIEECDDGNTASGDGCSSNCTTEKGFNCSTNDNYQSICDFVYLLDLDYRDNLSSLNYPDVIVYETPLFLLDISFIDFVIIDNHPLRNISVVIMKNPNGNNGESVEVAVLQAVQDNRLENTSDVYGAFTNEELDPDKQDALENILGAKIYQGELYKPTSPAVDPSLFVKVVLASLRYNYDDETDFVPRNICVVAQSDLYNSVGCINVTFVGENVNPPELSYALAEIPMFIEEQLYPVPILNGTFTITDPDHPMYLMQSATVVLFAVDVDHETLDLDRTFPLITHKYDPDNGRLTITGNATTNVYEEIFKNVVYFNSNDEPNQLSMSRHFQLLLFDGEQSGVLNGISLFLVNLNDVPTILFSGNSLMFYYERNGSVIVDSDIFVLDPDPNEMIQSITIYLLYAVDGNNEEITISNPGSIPNITHYSHKLELTGKAAPSNYTTTLKTLRYEHKDSYPGNPTAGNRTLMFVVEDDTPKSKTLNFTFYVQPINDAPTLRFNNMSGATSKSLSYFEDDPLLLFAKDLYLRDVDSDISTATLHFIGLLNGDNDYFTINQTLAAHYGITIYIIDGVNSRSIIATGNSSSEHYREVLRTLGYVNLLTNNSVTDGVRTITLLVNDTKGYNSETVTISLAVSERNDQPSVTIDEVIQFTEGSKSVDIVTLHLIDIIDEEMNNITNINITLTATNGDLDEEDKIFIRTPFYPLITYADVTNRSVYISFEGTVEQFEEVLKSIRYVNQEDEPTYYVNVTSKEKLNRVIIVQIIDDNVTHPSLAEHHISINMTLVNDNTPVINLNLTSSSCLTSYPGVLNNLQKRDTRSFGTRLKRRLHLKRKTNDVLGLAPSVLTAYSQYSFLTENITCLSNITIIFNANTTTPVVEVKPDLQDLLTLYPSDISTMPHYGRWMDRKTLSIQFMGCYIWPTTSANVMAVLFNSQQDECNVTTPCLSGICFLNKTGCPLIGLHSIKTNTTFSFNVTTESPPTQASRHGGLMSSYIILALIVTVSLAVLVVSIKVLSTDKKLQNRDQKFLKSEKLIQELLKPPETLESKDKTLLTLQMSNLKDETPTNAPLQLENPSAVKTSGNASTTTDDISQSSYSNDLSTNNDTNLAQTVPCEHLPSIQSNNQSSQLQTSTSSCQSLTSHKENLTSSDKRLVESRGSHGNV